MITNEAWLTTSSASFAMFRRSASAVGLKRPGYGMRHHPGCSNDGSCRHCGVAHHLWLQMWLSRYRCIYLYLDMYISFNINVNSCIHTIFTCVDIYNYVCINIYIYILQSCVYIYIHIYVSLRPYHFPRCWLASLLQVRIWHQKQLLCIHSIPSLPVFPSVAGTATTQASAATSIGDAWPIQQIRLIDSYGHQVRQGQNILRSQIHGHCFYFRARHGWAPSNPAASK